MSLKGIRLGSYVVGEFIGNGRFSDVFLSRHVNGKQNAATKIIRMDVINKSLKMFERETAILTQLNHGHIVQVYDVGRITSGLMKNHPYIHMEFMEGGSMRDRIGAHDLTRRDKYRIMDQTLEGLIHLHSRGILHLDLNPGNLLFDQEGQVKLSDFGLSKQINRTDVTSITSVGGRSPFQAPEQYHQEEDVGPASDIYQVGALFQYLITGIANPFFIMDRYSEDPALVQIVEKAMMIHVDERYSSARHMRTDVFRERDRFEYESANTKYGGQITQMLSTRGVLDMHTIYKIQDLMTAAFHEFDSTSFERSIQERFEQRKKRDIHSIRRRLQSLRKSPGGAKGIMQELQSLLYTAHAYSDHPRDDFSCIEGVLSIYDTD